MYFCVSFRNFSPTDGASGMLSGSLTPPDKVNGEHHAQQQHSQQQQQHSQQHPQHSQQQHWSTASPLAISTMAGPMQTPPSSPPMHVERFG